MTTKFAYLIKVEPGQNNNKFYRMEFDSQKDPYNFTVEYGRVGNKASTFTYPTSDWDKK